MTWVKRTNTSGGLPGWVEVDKDVAVISGRGQAQTIALRRVERVTATQVIVEGERYSIRRSLDRMGPHSAYDATPFLADPQSKAVKAALLESRVRTAKWQVDRANDAFQKDPNITTAKSLTLSVELWSRCQQDLRDATVKQA